MKKIILLSFALISFELNYCVAQLFSKQNTSLKINGYVVARQVPMAGSQVLIFKNGTLIDQFKTDKKGKLVYTLQQNNKYRIMVKKRGYVSKYIEIDTHTIAGITKRLKYSFEVKMVKNKAKILNAVKMADVLYDSKKESFTHDKAYTKKKHQELKQTKKEVLVIVAP